MTGKIYFALILFLIFSCKQSGTDNTNQKDSNNNALQIDSVISDYKVEISYFELPDLITAIQYDIVKDFDTLYTYHSSIRDLRLPVYFWSPDQKMLIFEESLDFNRKIKILSIDRLEVVYSINALINDKQEDAANYYDTIRGLIFAIQGDNKKIGAYCLIAIDINKKSHKVIHDFQTSGDPITGIPYIIDLDVRNRKIISKYEDSNVGFLEVEINY